MNGRKRWKPVRFFASKPKPKKVGKAKKGKGKKAVAEDAPAPSVEPDMPAVTTSTPADAAGATKHTADADQTPAIHPNNDVGGRVPSRPEKASGSGLGMDSAGDHKRRDAAGDGV